MNITNPLPRAATEAGLFLFTLGLAYMQDWRAHDVAWSMWITSLISGLLYIYISLLSGNGVFNRKTLRKPIDDKAIHTTPKHSIVKRVVNISALFMAMFFTFHFGFFHFVHSQFMMSFFPLEGVAENGAFIDILFTTISLYYGFILVGIIKTLPSAMGGDGDNAIEMNMSAPYSFVIRNHIMIILLGGLSHFIDSGYIVYLVITFYFFPFDIILGKKKNKDKKQSEKSNAV